jgi:ATP-dependent protease ClpP protease subunit
MIAEEAKAYGMIDELVRNTNRLKDVTRGLCSRGWN